jgi:PKD domain/Putative Ig domain
MTKIVPEALPDAILGKTYSQSFVVNGGTPPYSYTLGFGVLPPGLTFSNATLSGVPTQLGAYTFTVIARDSTACETSTVYPVNVVLASSCPLMVPDINVVWRYSGSVSGCSDMTRTNCFRGEKVDFAAQGVGYDFSCGLHAFTWTFGDGMSAGGKSVSHVYDHPGMFGVTLIISNDKQVISAERAILILAPQTRRRAVGR